MHHARSLSRRLVTAAVAIVLPSFSARAQAPAPAEATPATIESIGIGATSLSASGSSSVGWHIYYTGARDHFVYDTELAIFTQNGAQTAGGQFTGAYGWGPYLNRSLSARERSSMFFAGGGFWKGDNDLDPMLIVGAMGPLGPFMGRLGYGAIMSKNATTMLFNVGVGMKFGQKP